MNIHEHQAKEILKKFGAPVPRGVVVYNTNEILTSLMLVYVALLILDYLVVGPWKDPQGYSFPKTRSFSDSGGMPLLFPGLRVHFGLLIRWVVRW